MERCLRCEANAANQQHRLRAACNDGRSMPSWTYPRQLSWSPQPTIKQHICSLQPAADDVFICIQTSGLCVVCLTAMDRYTVTYYKKTNWKSVHSDWFNSVTVELTQNTPLFPSIIHQFPKFVSPIENTVQKLLLGDKFSQNCSKFGRNLSGTQGDSTLLPISMRFWLFYKS